MFTIDKMARTPIYEQLINQFELLALSGEIGPDGKLPSVRTLSQKLNINPNTIQRAYNEIEKRGMCYSVQGCGRYLNNDALEKINLGTISKAQELRTVLCELKDRGVSRDSVVSMIDEVYGIDDK